MARGRHLRGWQTLGLVQYGHSRSATEVFYCEGAHAGEYVGMVGGEGFGRRRMSEAVGQRPRSSLAVRSDVSYCASMEYLPGRSVAEAD